MSSSAQKIALVTGAGTGLGCDLARRLAGQGYAVGIHYRSSRQGAERVKTEISQLGGRAEIFQADLSVPEQVEKLLSQITQTWGTRLDLLINNSGVYQPISLETLRPEDWLIGLQSTVTAAFLTTKACLPLLRQAGEGRIINIGDSSADRPTARDLALGYHVGKTGVWMLTRSFARSEIRYGMTVNMVSPGFLENSVPSIESEQIPAGRLGTFADIWTAVEFLLQPQTSYLTGSNLIVSGGWNLR